MKSIEFGRKAKSTLAFLALTGAVAGGIAERSHNEHVETTKLNSAAASMAVKYAARVEQLAAEEHVKGTTTLPGGGVLTGQKSTLYEFDTDKNGNPTYYFTIARDGKTDDIEAVHLVALKDGEGYGVRFQTDEDLTDGGNDPDRVVHTNSWNVRLAGNHNHDDYETLYAATPDAEYDDKKLNHQAIDKAQILADFMLHSAATSLPIEQVISSVDNVLIK